MKIEDLKKSASQMTDDELSEAQLKIRADRRNFGRRQKKDKGIQLQLDIDNLDHIIAKFDKKEEE